MIFDISKQSSSNLISNPEMIEQFNIEAKKIACSLYHKYYQVFEVMDVDDVVDECWKKVIGKDISYDPSKGTSFRTFVYMIVSSKLIDLTRIINHTPIPNIINIDDSENQVIDTVQCPKSRSAFKQVEILCEADEFIKLFNNLPELKDIINLYIMGYNTQEVSNMTGVRYDLIRKTIFMMGDIRKRRDNNKCKPFGDILYYETEDWDKSYNLKNRKDFILYFSSLIRDIETNICLRSVVDGVLKDWSYKKISEKLNTGVYEVKRTLHRYEGVLV